MTTAAFAATVRPAVDRVYVTARAAARRRGRRGPVGGPADRHAARPRRPAPPARPVGRLLAAGAASGGPAFRALAPVYEPADATPTPRVTTRLGALRHHRTDAHRAAWAAAGLTLDELQAPADDDPRRRAVEDDTNRRDAPVHEALSAAERLELLAIRAALPG